MTNQLATTNPNGKNGNLTFVAHNPASIAERLKNLIVNGKSLSPDERMALAQYAIATGLNPFVGECYFLPGIGPGPGIAGWRVKAEEQLEYEANKARVPAARYWCEYLKPDEGEARWDVSKGDIAVKAVLHDTITKTEWEKRTLGYYIELVKGGIKETAWEVASKLTGNEPVWTAVGVVRGSENFGPSEKMDRYERACKRAEKAAIRKRFPRVNLPEPVGFDESDIVDVQVHNVPATEEQIIGQLYAETAPAIDQTTGEIKIDPLIEIKRIGLKLYPDTWDTQARAELAAKFTPKGGTVDIPAVLAYLEQKEHELDEAAK